MALRTLIGRRRFEHWSGESNRLTGMKREGNGKSHTNGWEENTRQPSIWVRGRDGDRLYLVH